MSIEFKSIVWSANPFLIQAHTDSVLSMLVQDLAVDSLPATTTRLDFINPMREWAALWDTEAGAFVDRPWSDMPGPTVLEAFSKPVGRRFKFSFASHHELGLLRWGFGADGFTVIRAGA
ncbi:hypothetical protein [Pseudoxanthomonas mexicana]